MIRKSIALASLAALVLFLLAGTVWAGSSNGLVVDWFVLSSGGAPAESSSGSVTLNGTLGQTAIGPSVAAHGDLGGGFWYGVGQEMSTVYLPIMIRNH
ncbi:MAG: hypothetical protein P8074_16340 [Anaerolineales bacterium]|jgi:hypothetical protein